MGKCKMRWIRLRKTALTKTFTIILLSGLILTSLGLVQLSAKAENLAQAPSISSVSPIVSSQLQTITILGSGFGNVYPQTEGLGDGSVDTVGGGSAPTIQIRDNRIIDGWTAGYEDQYSFNAIGIVLVSWSDTKIVLGGFGSALSTTGPGQWNLMPGDPLQILVMVLGQVATYDAVVTGISGNTIPQSGAPTISSVSLILADQTQTIVITGTGFGNTQPTTVSLGDGSINTIGQEGTPVIQVHDDGWYGWEAGTQDGPNTGADLIGVILLSWSDTKIVLGGFGSVLYTDGQYKISNGDPIRIVVITSNGEATYNTQVAAGKPASSTTTTPLSSTAISSSPSPSFWLIMNTISLIIIAILLTVIIALLLLMRQQKAGNFTQGLAE